MEPESEVRIGIDAIASHVKFAVKNVELKAGARVQGIQPDGGKQSAVEDHLGEQG